MRLVGEPLPEYVPRRAVAHISLSRSTLPRCMTARASLPRPICTIRDPGFDLDGDDEPFNAEGCDERLQARRTMVRIRAERERGRLTQIGRASCRERV